MATSRSRQTAFALRTERADDRTFLARLYASTRIAELAPLPWSQAQKAEFLQAQFEAQYRHYGEHYPEAERSIIEVDGRRAGRLYVSRWRQELRIVDIALLPEYRDRGIGSVLLRELMDEAAGAGKTLTIHVEKNNPALRLYRRLGFQPVEDRGVYDLLEWRNKNATN